MTQRADLTPSTLRRNTVLGIANGVFFRFGQAFIDPSMVLTWFLAGLTTSRLLLGLLYPITRLGYLLPMLLVSDYVDRQPRKIGVYRLASALRVGTWFILTALVFVLGDRNPAFLLPAFFVLYTVNQLGSGLHGLAFLDIIGRVIPGNQRGSFFAWRDFLGGFLGLAGSALVAYILHEERGLSFSASYGLLFLLGGLTLAGALGSFCFAIEPPDDAPRTRERQSGLAAIRAVMASDANYMRFIAMRVLLVFGSAALPFYSVYARDTLGAPAAMAGTYSGFFTVAVIGSTMFWGRLSDRKGTRWVFLLAALIQVLCPLVPLALGDRLSYLAFAFVFPLLGIAETGVGIGAWSFALDAAPPGKRVLYVSLVNTVLGLATMATMGSGLVAQHLGLPAMFATSVVSMAGAALLAAWLREPRQMQAVAAQRV